jgi:hypothetical protein
VFIILKKMLPHSEHISKDNQPPVIKITLPERSGIASGVNDDILAQFRARRY